jgi:hypothetical protein
MTDAPGSRRSWLNGVLTRQVVSVPARSGRVLDRSRIASASLLRPAWLVHIQRTRRRGGNPRGQLSRTGRRSVPVALNQRVVRLSAFISAGSCLSVSGLLGRMVGAGGGILSAKARGAVELQVSRAAAYSRPRR